MHPSPLAVLLLSAASSGVVATELAFQLLLCPIAWAMEKVQHCGCACLEQTKAYIKLITHQSLVSAVAAD